MRIFRQESLNLYLLMPQRATKPTETRKSNKVPETNRKTNQSNTWTSRLRRTYSGKTSSRSIENNLGISGCIVSKCIFMPKGKL